MSDLDEVKKKKGKKIVNLIKITCFLIVLLVYMFGLGEWFRAPGSFFEYYYEQPENTIDIAVIGSSHVYSGYIPAVLWKEYGVSSFNLHGWSISIWTSYYYAKEALLTQDLDVIFLDVSSAIQGAVEGDTAFADEQNLTENIRFNAGVNRYELLLEYAGVGENPPGVGGVNDLTLYHNEWKDSEKLFTPYKRETKADALRNFGALYDHVEDEVFNYNYHKDIKEPSARTIKYLNKFVELSKKENFRLVFVLTPFTSTKEKAEIFSWLHQYADENNIDFIDFFGEAGVECGFDLLDDMSDVDHLRYTGAMKVTRYVGDYLQKIGYQPRKNANSEQLDKDADVVYRMLNELYQWDEEAAASSGNGEENGS